MALAKKCDLCGRLYEHYKLGDKPYNKFNAMRLYDRADGRNYDLCKECRDELVNFMNSRRKDGFFNA